MLPPGPSTPAFWQTLRFVSDPREYSRAQRARFGSAVRFHVLNGKGVSVTDPELARQVFAADPDGFDSLGVLGEIFGPSSVLATSSATHRRQRKLLNPRFHGARIKSLLQVMERVVSGHMAGLESARTKAIPVSMIELGQQLTLDVILETAFGASEALDRPAAQAILRDIIDGLSPLFVFAAPLRSALFPPWRAFTRRRAAFDSWVDAIVTERRRTGALGADILGMLLEATYEDGSPMDGGEIRDQLFTLLLAGHETTAVAFAWSVYWLLRELFGPRAAPRGHGRSRA